MSLVLVALFAAVAGAAVGGRSGGSGEEGGTAEEPERVELPRGGTELLPRYRLVGYYGAPQDEQLGALGIGSPAAASARLRKQAAKYERARDGRPVMPFLELIATVANADPGVDGLYRTQQPKSVIQRYLDQAREDESILVLDIQPGRADMLREVRRLEQFLVEPDVGLALDPEWHVEDGEVPGQVIGSVPASVVNRTAARLSRLVRENGLPQKLLIVHRFTAEMIENPERLRQYPGVAIVFNVDGFGLPAEKEAKYEELSAPRGSGIFSGFKLFYLEDTDLMSPSDVLGLKPRPDVVVYE